MLYFGFLTYFFLLGLEGVGNTSSSRVCEDKPMKEKDVTNDVEGVDGVVGDEGRDTLSGSLEDSSEWKGEGFVNIGGQPTETPRLVNEFLRPNSSRVQNLFAMPLYQQGSVRLCIQFYLVI